MPIVGGLDIHRRQITSGYPGTETGQVCRGQVSPADREHLRAWLARFAGREDAAFAAGGCTGWRYADRGSWPAAGAGAHLAGPAGTAFARGRKRHAKTDKTDCRHLRMLLAEGRLPECWIPPARILECRALLETYHDLRAEHTAWVQRIHAVLFHHGAPALGAGTLRTEPGVAALRTVTAECCHRPGSCRSPPRWRYSRRWRAGCTSCGTSCSTPPGSWPAPRCWPSGCTGSGRLPRWRSPAGWPAKTGSPPPARRSGSPGWTSPCGPRTARARPGGFPARTTRAALGSV